MANPSDYRYTESHEWFHCEGDVVTVGVTRFAVDELTDITYVELKTPGTVLAAGDTIGEIESVKTTSDVYATVPGEVVEVNDALQDDPGLLNRDPFGDGWLARIRTTDTSSLDRLMDQATYDQKHPVG